MFKKLCLIVRKSLEAIVKYRFMCAKCQFKDEIVIVENCFNCFKNKLL